MEKIKSIYIIQTILSYTNDIIKFKLFTYSKKYQKLLNIGLIDYQKKFFDKIRMNSFNNYFKYLCAPKYEYDYWPPDDISYNKNEKNELLKKDLLKYNINIDDFKNYVKNYFVKYKEIFIKELNQEYKNQKQMYYRECVEDIYNEFNDIRDYHYQDIRGFQEFSEGIKLEIDINSPLFDIFYESKLFGELFIIPIDFYFINNYELKEDYINTFNKLNDINSNYSSIFIQFTDNKDINRLKDFNIKFNKIKNLNIKIYEPENNFDYNLFFRKLFSLKDIENNIIDLYITNNCFQFDRNEIDENILENLNKFKKLENLKLNGLRAKNIFELKIKTLKSLNIEGCQKIHINSDIELSLKKLILPSDNISNSLLKLPQLEYLDGSYSIDFNSLYNLKKIKFFLGEVFTQILPIKSLKEIHITSDDLIYLKFDLASIHDKNPSVNKLIYKYIKEDDVLDYNINEILNKFPNLTELIFKTDLTNYRWQKNGWDRIYYTEINLEIKENSNCKINKITLLLYYGNIEVDCQNFESLEKFVIKASKILNISTSIPMLSNNRNIIYNSLIELYLHLEQQLINLEIFKNLNNCIDNMPNLKKIDLLFMTNINRNKYEEFKKKILSLKLDFINIDFRFHDENGKDTNESHFNNDNYSYEELKIINKNILYLNFENIKIKKYPDNK